MLVSIVAFVITIAVLILVHEAGHFFVAKRLGVRVLCFSIGFPPRIFSVRHGETEYAIGAIPLGGFNQMLGDEVGEEPKAAMLKTYLGEIRLDLLDAARRHAATHARASGISPRVFPRSDGPADAHLLAIARGLTAAVVQTVSGGAEALARPLPGDPEAIFGRALKPEEEVLMRELAAHDSVNEAFGALCERRPTEILDSFRRRSFPTQSLLKRTAIVLAGPAANFVFAPILLTIVLMWGVPTLLPVVGKVEKGMPAYAAGLVNGDRVLSVNGHATKSWAALSEQIKSGDGAPVHLEVAPAGIRSSTRELVITPKRVDEKTITGEKVPMWIIGVTARGDEVSTRFGPIRAVRGAVLMTGRMLSGLYMGIAQIVEGKMSVRQGLGGPIMIAQIAGQEAHRGFADLAMFIVMFSLELAILNILPIPFLDGGHLLFFACEAVRGKPLELRHREIALQIGLFVLAVLIVFTIFNDISRIIGG